MSDKGNSRDGSACLGGITPIIPVHILENRPFHSGQGCFSDILGWQVCVCFSPFCTYTKGSSESKSVLVSNAHKKPSMARPAMVSGAFKNVCKKPISFTSTQRSTERSCWKVKSTRNTEFTATSGLQPRPQSSFKKIALAPHDYAVNFYLIWFINCKTIKINLCNAMNFL